MTGIVLFNRGEYFAAHEVWEDLWRDCTTGDRRFYQSLIQAAVALYHWGNGNRIGAGDLFAAGRGKTGPYRPAHLGLDLDRFWFDVEAILTNESGTSAPRPRIELSPPPVHWPEPPPDTGPRRESDHDR
ncbi:DUF309 domain-containing protein [Fimbriiglobus ruber]|uniref:DUF309 domain-containing protein n=1 Tax=Fimbriiglobus ruber TaxID=1908690 RepID=A0A225DZ73_9BACT|nr:DUF309 domain-containing protein [Fimbriiglobus ruber]OWK43818.1 hypothetical protein FRUB_03417 [Fimbriiglobus ruber]